MTEFNWSIKPEYKKISEMTDKEIEQNSNCSQGFWYDFENGYTEKFINLLQDEATQKTCREAIHIIRVLEDKIYDYIEWC
jgi:hypothetical protein